MKFSFFLRSLSFYNMHCPPPPVCLSAIATFYFQKSFLVICYLHPMFAISLFTPFISKCWFPFVFISFHYGRAAQLFLYSFSFQSDTIRTHFKPNSIRIALQQQTAIKLQNFAISNHFLRSVHGAYSNYCDYLWEIPMCHPRHENRAKRRRRKRDKTTYHIRKGSTPRLLIGLASTDIRLQRSVLELDGNNCAGCDFEIENRIEFSLLFNK